jgi:hypothetical protein
MLLFSLLQAAASEPAVLAASAVLSALMSGFLLSTLQVLYHSLDHFGGSACCEGPWPVRRDVICIQVLIIFGVC